MKTQRPIPSDDEHVVIKFRPRTSAHPPGRREDPREPENTRHAASDLSRYERLRDEPDDFRHRMLANIAAFAFTLALTAIGIWLAMSIADLRKTQDCVLMGRRDCARISVAAEELTAGNRAGVFAAEQSPPPSPTSIELRAPLRYTGTRLLPGEQGIAGQRARLLHALPELSANISKA